MLDVFMKSERETVEFLLERYPVNMFNLSLQFFWGGHLLMSFDYFDLPIFQGFDL